MYGEYEGYSIGGLIPELRPLRTVRIDTYSILSFVMYCAKAIRKRGDPTHHNATNIVELKFLLLKSRIEAYPIAFEALKGSLDIAFYYYVLTMGSSHSDGL